MELHKLIVKLEKRNKKRYKRIKAIKTYYKSSIIQTVWYCCVNRQVNEKRIEKKKN